MLVETLTDNFDDANAGNKWTKTGDTNKSNFVNNRLEITSVTNAQYNQVVSTNIFDLQNSAFFVQVVNAGNQAIPSHETIVYFDQSSGGIEDWQNKVYVTISGNTVHVRKVISNVNSAITSTIAFDSTAHRWVRFRELNGTTYVDFSPDGKTWINQWSFANVISVTDNIFGMQEGTWQVEGSTTVSIFDNFNYRSQMLQPARTRPRPFAPGIAR